MAVEDAPEIPDDELAELLKGYIRPEGKNLDHDRYALAVKALATLDRARSLPYVLRDPSPESATLRRRLAESLNIL